MQPSYLKDFLDCHFVGGKTEGKKIRSVYSTNIRERLTKNGRPASEEKDAAGDNIHV